MLSLGINYSQTHDSSACLVRDGDLLFAVAEERLSRVKQDGSFPRRAIQACLDFARVSARDLDEVCFGWPNAGAAYRRDLSLIATGRWQATYLSILNSTRHFASMWHQESGVAPFRRIFGPGKTRFRSVDHHLAHAISAYSCSGFEDAAVVVMDGRGAWEATSIWHGRDGRLEHLLTIKWPDSLGLFYAMFTQYLGFVPYSDEWKVMGLAPYGRPGVDLHEFISSGDSPYHVHVGNLVGREGLSPKIMDRLGPQRVPESEIDNRHRDIAFAVQDVCEDAVASVVRLALQKSGSRNLCLAGGVALNSKANGKIAASGMVENIFVQPAASDDGVALGAALAPYMDKGGTLPMKPMRHAYLGPEFDDAAIRTTLDTYRIRYEESSDPAERTADLLANGKIVGWFQGRMEFGPRALGSRSILADPRDPQMNSKVNNAVKFREWWRPFAPSFKKEAAPDYLESGHDSPFMVLTAQVRQEKRAVIPSVTHVDGSARPQTVERQTNPLYYRLVDAFGKRTGVPAVMNTSFNLRGEPIVHTPTDAIRTFFSSGMDALVVGSFVVEK